MDKQEANICRQALIQEQSTFGGEDLLTECITWCTKFGIRCVTMGTDPNKEKENDKEIRSDLNELKKVQKTGKEIT